MHYEGFNKAVKSTGRKKMFVTGITTLRRMEKAGVILTTTEAAVFEWVGGAGHPQFNAISKLVQERMLEARQLNMG